MSNPGDGAAATGQKQEQGQAAAQGQTQAQPPSGPHIQVTKSGPYQVTGHIPLDEQIIHQVHLHNEFMPGREIPQADVYSLCRCGGSHNAPFCDGTHMRNHFEGTETADMRPFADRIADTAVGHTMTLLDDDRCAYVRFCHREPGDVWQLTENDNNPENRHEAIVGVSQCVAGRLVEVDKDGNPIEKPYQPEIVILQDQPESVSGPIWVKGPIPMTSAEGKEYEVRNRMALCRCGRSDDKPFCDATHVRTEFRDSSVKAEYEQPRERPVGFAAKSEAGAA
ncbi:MAG: CDGSH iron-sulfur domain-containing protein [Cellulomonadaceae bacterium]|jgi:CDGSH-type Zn-finger protein|nr:CDGSH iron-sulfur domain-containing protein [Cellulomonadaceae bacterium]